MKLIGAVKRPEQLEFFLRLHGLWEGIIQFPRPPPPPFDIDTMEPIEPPWQAIKECELGSVGKDVPSPKTPVAERILGKAVRKASLATNQKRREISRFRQFPAFCGAFLLSALQFSACQLYPNPPFLPPPVRPPAHSKSFTPKANS